MADPYGFAVDAVKTTQGIYNKANRPAWSRNAIGGMAFTFKTYSINYVEMLHRMWTQGGKEGKQGRERAHGGGRGRIRRRGRMRVKAAPGRVCRQALSPR